MNRERFSNSVSRWKAALMAQHRRQPLLTGAAFFLVGIACGYRWGGGLAAWNCVGVCMVAWAFGTFRLSGRTGRSPLVRGALLLLPLFLGWTRSALDGDGRAEEARRIQRLAQPQTLVCRVGPDVTVTPFKGHSVKVAFEAEAVRSQDGALTIRHLPVNVTWFGAADERPQPGEQWRLRGRGSVKKDRSGLKCLAINTGEGRAERLAAADTAAWRVRAERARRAATRRVTLGIEDWGDIPALNQAMLLGNRHVMPIAMRRVFVDSGTIHVFAISGLHIVLVAAVLTLIVAALGVPRNAWVLCVGPPLVFYTVMTGARPSAIRACLMTLLYFFAPLIGRKPNGLSALAGTALIVHARQPALLYDIGCVLSFTVMAGLVVFCRPFCEMGRRLCRVDRLRERVQLLKASGDAVRARRAEALVRSVIGLADSFAVSLAAWLASVPLTAYYFGRFTPGGLFANLVVGPCCFLIVVAGCLGMAASCFSAWLASCFNHAAGLFTLIMVKTAEGVAACPGANMRVGPWPPWLVWSWFGALLAFAVWLRFRRPRDGLAWLKADGALGVGS